MYLYIQRLADRLLPSSCAQQQYSINAPKTQQQSIEIEHNEDISRIKEQVYLLLTWRT